MKNFTALNCTSKNEKSGRFFVFYATDNISSYVKLENNVIVPTGILWKNQKMFKTTKPWIFV